MAVVINDFEVMPQTQSPENQTAEKKAGANGSEKTEMSDHDIKKILERRAERLERVAAH
ncbi:MAG: hypothetical protein ABIP06_00290 [Pyrinomonadaceae bacterium]